MPTRNINLTPEMDEFVARQINKGSYANASEVCRAGLRALERFDRENEARMTRLLEAIDAGDSSPDAQGDVMGRLKLRIRRRAEALGRTSVA